MNTVVTSREQILAASRQLILEKGISALNMIIVEQGAVVEICAKPGEYKYDAKSEPTIFQGNLSDSIKQVFEQMGKRFQFGGQPANDQRVYYFNTKEIVGNKYGTPSPVPFHGRA